MKKGSLTRLLAAISVTVSALHFDISTQTTAEQPPWHLVKLNIVDAHEISRGANTTVAVLDSGVSPHPDIIDNLLPGISYVNGEKDGRLDKRGHGTAIAGIIAGTNSAPPGILGIAPETKILPVKVLDDSTGGNSDNLAEGIRWATSNGTRIINISAVGGPNPEVRKAVAEALSKDAIVIASAGNRPEDSIIQFPAYIDNVVAVGATSEDGGISTFSVTGDRITLTAPGSNIATLKPDGGYTTGTGTSASAAIVSGVAALVWSRYPELSAAEVVHRMTATAVDKGAPGRDPEYGFGIVDPVAALTADVPPLASTASPTPRTTDIQPQPDAEDGPIGQFAVIVVAVVASLGGIGLVLFLLIIRLRRRNDSNAGAGPTGRT